MCLNMPPELEQRVRRSFRLCALIMRELRGGAKPLDELRERAREAGYSEEEFDDAINWLYWHGEVNFWPGGRIMAWNPEFYLRVYEKLAQET